MTRFRHTDADLQTEALFFAEGRRFPLAVVMIIGMISANIVSALAMLAAQA